MSLFRPLFRPFYRPHYRGYGESAGGVEADPPVNTELPVITGDFVVGQELTCSTGVWSNSPVSYTYQWRRNSVAIVSATTDTYIAVELDAGKVVDCVVTATNASGSGVAIAVGSSVLGVPLNTVAPAISGTARVAQTLTATTGTWDNAPSSYTYQWTRNGSNISGATSSTYLTVVADMGTLVRCVVTAINAGGSSLPATSNSIDIFNYDDVSNLAVWLDANDPACVLRDTGSGFVPALNGEAVARWVDKSTNGHILAQTVALSRPTLSTSNGPSGGRAINFDGADDFLLKVSLVFDFPCTVFTVMRQNSFANGDYIYDTRGGGSRAVLVQRSIPGQVRGPSDSPVVAHTLSTWNTVTQRMSASVNTIQIDSGAVNSGTVAASAGANTLILGANNLGLNSWCHVDFAAFIAYSRVLTDPEIATVQATLKSIYGTP